MPELIQSRESPAPRVARSCQTNSIIGRRAIATSSERISNGRINRSLSADRSAIGASSDIPINPAATITMLSAVPLKCSNRQRMTAMPMVIISKAID